MKGRLGGLMVSATAFELGNAAVTLLILRTTDLLTPTQGGNRATEIALLLYTAYNAAAALVSLPAGHMNDRVGSVRAWQLGAVAFFGSYLLFATSSTSVVLLAVAFVLAGVGIGFAETAQSAAVAANSPVELRGSAFGLLAGLQAFGNLAASVVAGILWTVVSPESAFTYLAAWMLIALVMLVRTK